MFVNCFNNPHIFTDLSSKTVVLQNCSPEGKLVKTLVGVVHAGACSHMKTDISCSGVFN
jgi:hypothetical protein